VTVWPRGIPRRAPVHAFWCRIPSRPNFGDALTPWLIRRITGRFPLFVAGDAEIPKYFVTGSVIAYAGRHSTVWGSGIINGDDSISPEATLAAVRGPLTRARALACGAACPEVYGDPALLLPRLYTPPTRRRQGVGIVPHFSDMPRLATATWVTSGGRCPADRRLIDVQGAVESVIDEIASCEVVASSSLHGIITAHAYGVPAAWVKFRDLPAGDDSKFHDYFLSVGIDPPSPLRAVDDALDADEVRAHAMAPGWLELDALWRACPFAAEA
jgi:pyruvyltransferase